MLVTFKPVINNNMTYLIRLSHQYSINEDPKLSLPTQVDIQNLFTNSKIYTKYKVISIIEKTVSGNQDWIDWERKRLHWNNDNDDKKKKRSKSSGRIFDEGTIVQLNPMEIRTFYVELGDRFGIEIDDDSTQLAFL